MAMTQAAIREMAKKLLANQEVLRGCRGPHDLEVMKGTAGAGTRWRCKRCGGELSGEEARWYMMGFHHGCVASGAKPPGG